MEAFLAPLGLTKYTELFAEEELDDTLLRSMSESVLIEALTELGIEARDQLLLRAAPVSYTHLTLPTILLV